MVSNRKCIQACMYATKSYLKICKVNNVYRIMNYN